MNSLQFQESKFTPNATKEAILVSIKRRAGTIPINSVCECCKAIIGISDALMIFWADDKMIQRELQEAIDNYDPHICEKKWGKTKDQCMERKLLVEEYLTHCK